MKKTPLIYFLLSFATIAFFVSCNNSNQPNSCLSKEDSMKIANWNLLFGKKDSLHATNSNNQPVDAIYGAACIGEFRNFFSTISGTQQDMIRLSRFKDDIFTDYVLFNKDGSSGASGPSSDNNLYTWIGKNINNNPNATHFGIVLGKYVDPDPVAKKYPNLDPKVAAYISGRDPNKPYDTNLADDPANPIDPNKRKVGRVTIFIRPYPFASLRANAAPPPPGDDDYFNLGEINPPKP
jgi:hypothetical protein